MRRKWTQTIFTIALVLVIALFGIGIPAGAATFTDNPCGGTVLITASNDSSPPYELATAPSPDGVFFRDAQVEKYLYAGLVKHAIWYPTQKIEVRTVANHTYDMTHNAVAMANNSREREVHRTQWRL